MAKNQRPAENIRQQKPDAASPGLRLECRVMRLFARQRYFVRRSIVVYTEQNLNQATDLDVVAVRWLPPFRKHLQIVECKTAKEKPLDRIFWLTGVRAFTKANNATLVRNDTKWDIKAFARDCGVQLLDLSAITALEERLHLLPDVWPGLADADFIAAYQGEWTKQINSDQWLLELHRFLEGEARWQRPVLSMRYLLQQMRRLVRLLRNESDNLLTRVLLADCFGHFLMFATSLASQTVEMRPDDVRGLIHRDAKFGSSDPRLVSRLMRLAQRLTEETLIEVGVDASRINKDDFDFPEPQNVEDLIAIQSAVLTDSGTTEDLAAFADYIVWEKFVRGRDTADWIEAVYGSDAATLSRVSITISVTLERLEALPEGFAKLFEVSTLQSKIDALVDAIDSRTPNETLPPSVFEGVSETAVMERGGADGQQEPLFDESRPAEMTGDISVHSAASGETG